MSRSIGLTVASLLFAGCTIHAVAPQPQPNVMSPGRTAAVVSLDLSGVPQDDTCYQASGMRNVCVSGLRDAFHSGLTQVLNQFFGKVDGAPRLAATMKLVSFEYEPAAVNGVGTVMALRFVMKWQFQLADATGKPVLQIAETTEDPTAVVRADATDSAVKALVEAVLEETGRKLAAQLASAPKVGASAGPAVVDAEPVAATPAAPAGPREQNELDTCPRKPGESVIDRYNRCHQAQSEGAGQ